MKGDFTRSTFKPQKHYSGVRMQQGRVQLDADWNEQIDIAAHRVDSGTSDVVGRYAVPFLDPGFEITIDKEEDIPRIGKGHLYIDGILVENEEDTLITKQGEFLPDYTLPKDDGEYVAYLDVWQRNVTALEDDGIREVALGGPDTATRTQTVWQVRLFGPLKLKETLSCSSDLSETDWEKLVNFVPGKLRAHTASGTTAMPNNLCEVPAAAGYRRLENQLYRVEIHSPGKLGTATFKWSRDNGSIATSWTGQDGNDLLVTSLGRDQVLGFAAGQTVELTSDDCELHPEKYPSMLVKLSNAEGQVLTLDSSAPSIDRDTFGRNPKVRRWDSDGEVKTSASWIPLEDGVEVCFEAGCDYKAGDYWMIPARTAKSSIEWPANESTGVIRQGIEHHYCRLATLAGTEGNFKVTGDCRPKFPPLTVMTGLYYVGGDGQEAMPGNTLLQPLEVRVACGGWVLAGATVRFTAEGNGRLAFTREGIATSTRNWLDVDTGPDGIAKCYWKPDASLTKTSQQLIAALTDADGNPVNNEKGDPVHTIHFSANLSIAGQVAYESGSCLLSAQTVKEALDQLCKNAALYYVSGDGQEAMPGEWLRQLLQVRVANGNFPVKGTQVVFKVVEGDGGLLEGEKCKEIEKLPGPEAGDKLENTITVETDENGMASCCWRLDDKYPSQRVEARWLKVEGPPIYFNANLSIASQVAYESGSCLSEALTVKAALDQLCEKVTALSQKIEVAYVGGDGQEAIPGGWLPDPLQVRVTKGGVPLKGAQVTFRVEKGTGELVEGEQPEDTLDVPHDLPARDLQDARDESPAEISAMTDDFGLASCCWKLDNRNPFQRVSVRLGGTGESFPSTGTLPKELGEPEPPGDRELAEASNPLIFFNASLLSTAVENKSCCVTVGAEGDYPTLDKALQELLGASVTQISICLLQDAGTMAAFENDPTLIKEPTHISIKGYAQSVVELQGPLKLRGLSSFKMQDVDLVTQFGDDIGFITFEGCEQIVLEHCALNGDSAAGSLLRVSNALSVTFRDSTFLLQNQIGLEEFKAIVKGTAFENYARAGTISTRTRNAVDNKYVAMTPTEKTDLAKKILVRLQSGEVGISETQMPKYTALVEAVNVASQDFNLVGEALDDLQISATEPAGVAIIFDDANADVIMQNNHVRGGIAMYGAPDKTFTTDELLSLISMIKERWKEAPKLSPVEQSFHLDGNHLDRIWLGLQIMEALRKIPDSGDGLGGVYAEFFASENVFEELESHIFAASLGFNSNHSAAGGESTILTVVLASVAAFTGNRALRLNKILYYLGDPPGEAANLRVVLNNI